MTSTAMTAATTTITATGIQARVQSLYIYPTKSAQGVAVSQMAFDARGPVGDRRYMVIGADGEFRTQRNLPALTQLAVVPDIDGAVQLSATGRSPLLVAAPGVTAARRGAKVWADEVLLRDCGDAAAQWLTELLREPCRLLFQGDDGTRPIHRQPGREVSLADGYPLLLLSAAAVTEFGARLGNVVSERRFRPNIVLEGCAAHAEDSWQRLRIGGNTFSVAKPCERCSIPSLDPDTGVVTAGFNRALASYRSRDGQIYFGQNVIHEAQVPIAVGDTVQVLA